MSKPPLPPQPVRPLRPLQPEFLIGGILDGQLAFIYSQDDRFIVPKIMLDELGIPFRPKRPIIYYRSKITSRFYDPNNITLYHPLVGGSQK